MAAGDILKIIDKDDFNRIFVNVADYANLNKAVQAVSGTNQTILIASATTLSGNLVVPTSIELLVTKAGSINQGAYSLTINGNFDCGLYKVFVDTGTILFGIDSIKESYPEWFGFISNGGTGNATANTSAINRAIISYKKVKLNNCNTYINSKIVLRQYGSILEGNNSLSKLTAYRTTATDSFAMIMSYSRVNGTTDVCSEIITNLELDCAGQALTEVNLGTMNIDNASGIHLRYADYSVIENVKISNAGLASVTIEWCNHCIINKCTSISNGYIPFPNFTDPTWSVKANGNAFSGVDGSYNKITNSYAYQSRDLGFTFWNDQNGLIDNCTTSTTLTSVVTANGRGGASIESNSANCKISNCKIDNCTIGIFVASPKAVIENNNVVTCLTGINVVDTSDECFISGNVVTYPASGTGISVMMSKNITIANNILNNYYNIFSTANEGILVYNNKLISTNTVASVLIYNTLNSNAKFKNNIFTGKFAYGIQVSNVSQISILDNMFIGGSDFGVGISLDDSNYVMIKQNIITSDPISGYNPQFSIYVSAVSASNNITIENNTISGYTVSDSTNPYGISTQSTTPIIFKHTDLTRTLLDPNAHIYAGVGSVIKGTDVTRGMKMYVKTGTGNTGWVANYYSLT